MGARPAPLFEAFPDRYPAALVTGQAVALSIFIPGKPEPLHRHRARVVQAKGRAPFVQIYPDKRSSDYEDHVATEARSQMLATEVSGGQDFVLPLKACRILMTVRFNLAKPASYPKRVVHHTKKPDVDNYAKAILDGLVKGGILEDDGLVTDLTTFKRYLEPGHPEGVEVDLTAIPTETV